MAISEEKLREIEELNKKYSLDAMRESGDLLPENESEYYEALLNQKEEVPEVRMEVSEKPKRGRKKKESDSVPVKNVDTGERSKLEVFIPVEAFRTFKTNCCINGVSMTEQINRMVLEYNKKQN